VLFLCSLGAGGPVTLLPRHQTTESTEASHTAASCCLSSGHFQNICYDCLHINDDSNFYGLPTFQLHNWLTAIARILKGFHTSKQMRHKLLQFVLFLFLCR